MANVTRAVGLTLEEDAYARLEDFARAHHWKVAQAARVIVTERLDAWERLEAVRQTEREMGLHD